MSQETDDQHADATAEADAHREAHDGEDPSANVATWLHETHAATLSTLAVKPVREWRSPSSLCLMFFQAMFTRS